MNCFSSEVIKQLKHYVYRLIDPRNGQTFYVGEGKGNRIFAHVNCALKNYDGESFLEKNEDEDTLKIQTIKDITNSGLEVIHVIQRWGMDSATAFEVEGALIDAYPSLTNIADGHHNSEFGACNAFELEKRLSKKEFVDDQNNPKFIIIKTTYGRVNQFDGSFEHRLYEATRYCWKISVNKAKRYDYVLAVVDGIVKEVYKVNKWILVEDGRGRYEFEGTVAEEKIRKIFFDHKLPLVYKGKGMANPVLYSKY